MAVFYQIRVCERLDQSWETWFEPLSITYDGECGTLLAGPVIDQAALYGLIIRARDLGLTLLSVSRVDQSGAP